MRRSVRLNRDLDQVMEFFHAFEAYESEPTHENRAKVAAAAGPAQEALTRERITEVGPSPYPVANWASAFEGWGIFGVESVRDYVATAVAILEARRDDAERAERTLAGRVARFVAWPAEVRRLAGGSRRAQSAAFWSAVAAQTIGGLVVVGVVALLAWAARNAFG